MAVVTLDPKNRRIAEGPEFNLVGLYMYMRSEDLLREAEEKVREIVEAGLQEKRIEWSEIKQNMRDKLVNYYFKVQNVVL
ncbi:hypothetical protein ACVPOQ_15865 [Staphylococcus aureus]